MLVFRCSKAQCQSVRVTTFPSHYLSAVAEQCLSPRGNTGISRWPLYTTGCQLLSPCHCALSATARACLGHGIRSRWEDYTYSSSSTEYRSCIRQRFEQGTHQESQCQRTQTRV